mgnify:FL=1
MNKFRIGPQTISLLNGKSLLTILLLTSFLWSLIQISWGNIIHPGGGDALKEMISGFFNPDLSLPILRRGITAAWRTTAYATAGMTLALLIGFVLGVIASGSLPLGGRYKTFIAVIARGIAGFLRGIHELVWAWLFVVAFGLSPLPAVFALALHYGGLLARNFSEQFVDVPISPLNSLTTAGATAWQTLVYGRLPLALPNLVSYSLYRWECAVRSAAIMSFVGLGGLGFEIRIALDDLYYRQAWTFLFILMILVLVIDTWSSLIRKRMAL